METLLSNKILIIAYHFPPDAAVGGLRPQKFAKYLPEFGWQPYVLTIKEKFIEKLDTQRLDDVQRAIIVRTDFWRTPLQLFLDWRDKLKGKKRTGWFQIPLHPKGDSAQSQQASTNLSMMRRLILLFNWIPDDKIYWSFPALWACYKLVGREKIPIIMVTGPPHTAAIIGLLLSLLTRTQLIVDFRDPWVLWHRFVMLSFIERFFVFIESIFERAVVKRAKKIITTTQRLTDELRKQYPLEPQEKFVTIPNGYDVDDLPGRSISSRSKEKYCICYVGTFYLERNPESFFAAVQRALNEQVVLIDEIEVRLIGDVAITCGKPILEVVNRFGLDKCVTITGTIPYKKAMEHISNADLLLLLAPNQKNQVPAKAFEYIGVKRPILALTENDSATADLIRSVNAGVVADQNDAEQIYQALLVFFRNAKASTPSWYKEVDVSAFSRKRLTGDLVEILSAM